jgi:hypothetical protein
MISKAKSRQTTRGEEKFRYKVSSKPKSKGVYELNITVQSEECNGSKLLVIGILQHDHRVIPLEDYKYRPEIIKADIDGFISEAMGRGWEYKAAGPNFTLRASNDIFVNPFVEEKPEGFYHGRYFEAKMQ